MGGVKVIVEKILRDIAEEGDRVAKWWETVSRIVRMYIVPYIKKLDEKVEDSYLKMIEEKTDFYGGYPLLRRLRYSLSEFSRDVLKVIDVFLRATDSEYGMLCNKEQLGSIDLMEVKYRKIGFEDCFDLTCTWVCGVSVECSELDIEKAFLISSFTNWNGGLIIVGVAEKDIDFIKSNLDFFGYKYVIRTANRSVVFLSRKSRDFKILNIEQIPQFEDWEMKIHELIQKRLRGVIIALKDKKEKLTEILKENNIKFKIKEFENIIVISYTKTS
ncbi:hypothetical protein DRP05_11080 [Archaeoglobales archaeon]|nr:MAG: hypothetical protein DRP05_11080 [Archaeoglobales archaeon]